VTRGLAVVVVATLMATQVAHADDKMRAVALFDEGIKEMKAGNHAKACPLLAQSNRLVPYSGTRGALARCFTQLGKVASAWLQWRELADTAPTPDLRADAAANASKLEPRLPRYVVAMAAGAPKDVEFSIDGQPVAVTLDVAVPIDPGSYHFEARAEGYLPWRTTFTAVEGKTARLEVPVVTKAENTTVVDPPPAPARRGSSRRRLGIAIAGGGAIALVAGSVFGLSARSTFASAEELCGGSVERCTPGRVAEAQTEVESARSAAQMSTILFIAGGALAATGIVMIATAPSAERAGVSVAPSLHAGGAGLVISGGF
jgi:hypothetical protein